MTAPAQRRVMWDPALVAAYNTAATPSAEIANAVLCELGVLADRIVAGTELLTPATLAEGRTWRLPTTDGVPRAGTYLNAADLRPTTERSRYALALAQVGYEIHQSQGAVPSTPTERAGAWIQLAAAATACILYGILATWAVDRALTNSAEVRRTHDAILGSTRDEAERLRVFASTGVMPPPSDLQLATAGAITSAAAAARQRGVGQSIADTADKVGKALMIGGALWFASKFL